jgi:hypothetical protein
VTVNIPAPAQPRFSDVLIAQDQINVEANSTLKLTVLTSKLCAAERFVERFTRRRFAPEPALDDPDTGFQRRLVSIMSVQPIAAVSGSFPLTFDGETAEIDADWTAAEIQTALDGAWGLGAGEVLVSGGPLPTYSVSITFGGSLVGVQPAVTTDAGALGVSAAVVVTDCGFDSAPPVLKAFSTRGKTTVRVPDLRVIDSAPDPRMPQFQGLSLRGQRLQANQYDLGYGGYGPDGQFGLGDADAEPVTSIELIPFLPDAAAFGVMLGYGPWMTQDLQIVGRWGWLVPPPDVVDAVYQVAGRLYMERNAAFSDQMITADGVIWQFFKTLPSSTQAALSTYIVPNGAFI